MADVDHPKTHVEDEKDLDLPRTQPESPKHEGIDPLTESDTMYPAEDTKTLSEKQTKKDNDTPYDDGGSADLVEAQNQLTNPGEESDAVSESAESTQADDAARAKAADENVNADGKLPTDAKVANKVGSDKGNTSASNKPATQDAPAGKTDSKTASK